jgi:hypothetical protein
MPLFGYVKPSHGAMIGGIVAVASGLLQGLTAAGYLGKSSDPILLAVYSVMVSLVGGVLLLYGVRLRRGEGETKFQAKRE